MTETLVAAAGWRHEAARLRHLLPPGARRYAALLLALTVVAAGLEVLSVGAILPFLSALLTPDTVLAHPAGRIAYRLSAATTFQEFAVRAGIALVTLFVAKSLFAAWVMRAQFQFGYDNQVTLSRRLLAGYLRRDYEFFLGQNSAVLLKNVSIEPGFVAAGVITPLLQLVSESLVVIAMVTTLFIVDPRLALIAAVSVGGLFGAIYAIARPRVQRWGSAREQETAQMNRLAHQALSGVKEVKLTGCEQVYLDQLDAHGHTYAALNTKYQTAAAIPRLPVEVAAVTAMTAVILLNVSRGESWLNIVPTLTLYVLAAYRIMPSFNRVFSLLMTIRYYWPSVVLVEQGLTESTLPPRPAPRTIRPLQDAIEFDNVTFRYSGSDRQVLEHVSFRVAHGARAAFVGPSGSGKTTTVDLLLGLLHPESGEVLVDGRPLSDPAEMSNWRAQIGYVAQQVFIADATLEANIAFGQPRETIDRSRLDYAVNAARLDRLLATLPDGLQTQLGERGARLSGGERQRVAIARALYRRPRVLILDEATAGLDLNTELAIVEEVTALGGDVTVIIITHRLETVRDCSPIFLVAHARIVGAHDFAELVEQSPDFAALAASTTSE